ncbi:MAG: hypothetical protein LBT97_09740 [Planctomycetota bacterium]|jgi:hypothetical protein|nr:hypothetical protein [Planctomycetota bacterium]
MPPIPSKNKYEKRSVMGAPSKGDDARIISLHVKISANELQLWKKLSAIKGNTLGSFVLEPIRDKHPTKYEISRKSKKEK